MCKGENKIKMCSFYVSEVHLATMTLPYLTKKIEEGNIVYPILEKSLTPTINKLLNKITLKAELKEEIRKINWEEKKQYKYYELEQELNEKWKENHNIYFLIMGTEEYKKRMEKQINRYQEVKNRKEKIVLINCYEVTEEGISITEILKEHDKVLNTSGEREKEEIFGELAQKKEEENKKIAK